MNGLRLDRHPRRAVGSVGGNGVRSAHAAGRQRGAAVIGLAALYGFGAFIAIALFAYLVYALIRAEDF
ncbi:MAG: K(+)-transporting ATPase subunit F [Variovorax sp.]|nr:MAG: K(+)-transporting ATPase subunit F [Variovorax sp.]